MNIVIPAAGAGRRFKEAGYPLPKVMIDVGGMPMLSRVVKNILPRGEHRVIAAVAPGTPEMYDVQQVVVSKTTDGAARTVILAIHSAQLPLSDPLMVANADQLVNWGTDDFIDAAVGYEASIMTFRCEERDPKWSYVRLDENQSLVVRVEEKRPISDLATVGIYYWKRTYDFLRSAEEMIYKNDRTLGEFYVAPSFNYMPGAIRSFEIPRDTMHGLGTPEDLEMFLEQSKEKV